MRALRSDRPVAFSRYRVCTRSFQQLFSTMSGENQRGRPRRHPACLELLRVSRRGLARRPSLAATLWIDESAEGLICIEFCAEDQVATGSVRLPSSLIKLAATAMERSPGDLVGQVLGPDEIVLKLALLLIEDRDSGAKRGPLYTESLSFALATHLFWKYGEAPYLHRPPPMPGGFLRQVTDYVEANLEKDLSVQHLAALVGLSATHFSSLFRNATGVSPHQFLIQKRVERARMLLVSSTDSIAHVAIQVGFYDQSHLTRQMRRVLGICPGRLRRVEKTFS